MKTLTKHRELILQNLQDRRDHPTAKMVFDGTKDSVKKISFATVYNSLEYLVERGLVKKLNIDSDSARYDAILDAHSHLICSDCGKIIDIPALKLEGDGDFEEYNFQAKEISINVVGVCKDHSRDSGGLILSNQKLEENTLD
ncbi:MAG: transcriptional repressor [Leptospira sp.]|jgi:Fur family transcriptional regulator, peroxide stress response regulator|nr:transcriptional repressor [Leptospira sp.]NCS93301.1 transcriptional repressor [Leptospira sp.]